MLKSLHCLQKITFRLNAGVERCLYRILAGEIETDLAFAILSCARDRDVSMNIIASWDGPRGPKSNKNPTPTDGMLALSFDYVYWLLLILARVDESN